MRRCLRLSTHYCVSCSRKRGCPYMRPVNGITAFKVVEYKKIYGEPPDFSDFSKFKRLKDVNLDNTDDKNN